MSRDALMILSRRSWCSSSSARKPSNIGMNGEAACSGLSDFSSFIAPSRERLGPMVARLRSEVYVKQTLQWLVEASESQYGIDSSVAHGPALPSVASYHDPHPFPSTFRLPPRRCPRASALGVIDVSPLVFHRPPPIQVWRSRLFLVARAQCSPPPLF
jgi:hypothetical protein